MLSAGTLVDRVASTFSGPLQHHRDLGGPSDSGSTFILAAASAITAGVLLHYLLKEDYPNEPPEPDPKLPVVGHTLEVAKQRHRLHDWLAEKSSEFHGRPWQFKVVGRPTTVVITSPDSFEDIVKLQVDKFPRGADSQSVTGDFLGRGIIVSDGQEWFFQRKVSSHLFSMKMLQDVMHEVVREKVEVMCDVLNKYLARGQDVISLKRELTHFTSDVFAKIGFGVELNCLETGLNGQTHEFVEAFMSASHTTRVRFQRPGWLWRFERMLGLGEEGELQKAMKIVNDFTYKVIEDSIAAKKSRKSSDPPPKDIVSLFLHSSMATERKEITHGDQEVEMKFVRDMAINFIFAGKDTTSVAMGWFIIMMNRHPAILDKIRLEMRQLTPQLFEAQASVPTIDELKPLVYLDAAIRENLRLNAPAPSSGRTAAEDTELSDGTSIKKGTRIMMAMYASARQTTIWGPDAAEFKPERWIDSKTYSIRQIPPTQMFVFTAGRRMCPGRNMAVMEMKIALAVLLSRYELETVESPWDLTYEIAITHIIKGPFMVKVSPIGARKP